MLPDSECSQIDRRFRSNLKCPHPIGRLAVLPLTFYLAWVSPTIAQIVPDGTLGAESSVVTPLDAFSDQIDGGAVRGSNLFHSFQDFNIDDDRGAFFSNPTGIENILTRITGGNPSNIFGTLGVLGNANLFLINPNGIVFGPNARLDVGGSFFASTAEGITFLDGYQFSATKPDVPPLLTINVPIGLQFGANPGGIVNQSVATNDAGEVRGLEVPLGRTLGLIGGEIALEGGWLTAESGRVELGSVGGNNTVSLAPVDVGFALGYAGVENYQNIVLSQQALVDTRGERGGDVQVRANRLLMQDGGAILAETRGAGRSGILTIDATESVRLSGTYPDGSLVTGLSVQTKGPGDGGELTINTRQLSIRDGANILADTASEGQGGTLTINATESFELSGTATNPETVSALSASTSGLGEAGKIDIFTGRLLIEDGAAIFLNSLNQEAGGNAGTLNVNATESVEIRGITPDGNFGTEVSAATAGLGNGGEINITTGRLLVEGGGNLFLSTRNVGEGGRGGTLTVNASESVQLIGTSPDGSLSSGIFANTEGLGEAGEVNINTGQLSIRDGAGILIESLSQGAGGRAGTLTVNASELVQLSGTTTVEDRTVRSGIFASTVGLGDAGAVNIDTGNLLVQDGAGILLNSLNEAEGGRGGTLTVNARESVRLNGTTSDGTLSAYTRGLGDAGTIDITTGQLLLQNGAGIFLNSGNEGAGGRAGTFTVNASSVEFMGTTPDRSSINLLSASTNGFGDAGTVNINTRNLRLQDGGIIAVSTSGEGQGGMLNVNATESVELVGETPDGTTTSLMGTTFGQGDAATINITTGRLIIRDGAVIFLGSSNEEGIGGHGGILSVSASDSVEFIGTTSDGMTNSGVSAISDGIGNGGTVDIMTGRLIVRDGAAIGLSTQGKGQGGDLTINASESVELIGTASVPVVSPDNSLTFRFPSNLSSSTSGLGDGGTIDITTGQLIVRDGANISIQAGGQGRGGRLTVNASESVQLIGVAAVPNEITDFQPGASSFYALTSGEGDAGEIVINTGQLLLLNGAEISLSTLNDDADGRGGTLTVNATELVELSGTTPDGTDGSSIFASASGLGDGGIVTINTGQLIVRDGSDIQVATNDRGRGGTLNVNATESVEVSGTATTPTVVNLSEANPLLSFISGQREVIGNDPSTLSSGSFGTGDGGQINIVTERLSVRDGADISANTSGQGRGGTLNINATESVEVSGAAAIPAETTIVRDTESGPMISTITRNSFSRLGAGTFGAKPAGEINITTGRLSVRDGATISISTAGEGQGGTLTINASDSVELSGNVGNDFSTLLASTFDEGNAGAISIVTERLSVRDGAGIVASSFGAGAGGTVRVNATESVEVLGTSPDGFPSRLFAATRGTGDGGNVTVATERLRVADGANITVSSRVLTPEELQRDLNFLGVEIVEELGNPGSIDITADNIRLENGGLLDAISSTGRGGNIDVRARNIQLRNGLITASGRGNDPTFDGNIDIDAETLVLLDNSQIITSSTDPQGGSNITFRPIDGDNGALVLLQSPDSLINAQGELSVDGEIQPDPAKAPDAVVLDAESQLSRGCQDYAGSEFYVTGRGGIPPSPYDPLGGSSPIEIDWVEAPDSPEVEEPESRRETPSPVVRPLIEAQGWVVAADGTIVLTAQPYRGTPAPPALSYPDCQHLNLNAQ